MGDTGGNLPRLLIEINNENRKLLGRGGRSSNTPLRTFVIIELACIHRISIRLQYFLSEQGFKSRWQTKRNQMNLHVPATFTIFAVISMEILKDGIKPDEKQRQFILTNNYYYIACNFNTYLSSLG